MITTLLIVFALVAAGLLLVAIQPSEFWIARTARIPAPVATVFTQVNDFRRWAAWSPWARLDPAMKVSYDGAPVGTGASYAWSGNHRVGEGRSTITESRPNELIRIKLEFVRPFAGTNDTEFTFQPDGHATAVTWSMSGKRNFVMKAVGLFMNCDKMCGGQFERGFANLKAVLEPPKDETQTPQALPLALAHPS
ncbi:MAG: SRPBCC family protein [Verrucomicrobia bacterium]|nr:SRPBCC family protein [Verrucomicrobiota bacterium]